MNRILVVEDEQSMRNLLELMLRKEGYAVTTAESAVHAKEMLESGQEYDLVVCRNVVIYFDRPTQERLYQTFGDVLPSDGILVLGKVETLVGGAQQRFTLLDVRERIYRKA